MTTRPQILLVDDDVSLLQAIAAILDLEGFESVLCESAPSVVEFLRNLPISLVIIDIFMPDQDGMETIRAIREQWPQLPIIAMSGGWRSINPETILETARALGAQGALEKPFDRAALVEAVRRALNPD
ncbi:response regulator [Phenylobacterium sp.]|uniref:response regulator n=1 Tax=Phenylobacterium sp. TaxID=1871053 RepID=UPI00272F2B92|nr:response regulator [Phenylobacterium sp.]MDP2214629.1 response regulator [Phenylobacterium sp.]